MKKYIRLFTLLLLLIAPNFPLCIFAQTSSSKPEKGDGSKENPFLISSAEELVWFRDWVNEGSSDHTSACAKLIDNIDLSNISWIPIANPEENRFYYGIFDGNGKTISNLNCIRNANYAGLFGEVQGGIIKNIIFDKAHIENTKDGTGIVAARAIKSTISGIRIINGTVEGKSFIGSIVGVSISSNIINCDVESNVSGDNTVGGIVGVFNMWSGKANILKNIYSSCNVTCKYSDGGILTGKIQDNVKVRTSGLVAYNNDTKLTIKNKELQGNEKLSIGSGSLTNGFILGCNQETLKSGVVTYMLQEKNSAEDVVWGQNLSTENGDQYPRLRSTSRVYANCDVTLTCEGVLNYDGAFTNEIIEDKEMRIIHSNSKYTAETPATCKESGIRAHYECQTCHSAFEDAQLTIDIDDITEPLKSHQYDTNDVCTICSKAIPSVTEGDNLIAIEKTTGTNDQVTGYTLFKFTPTKTGIFECEISNLYTVASLWNSEKTERLFCYMLPSWFPFKVEENTTYYIGVRRSNGDADNDKLTINITPCPDDLEGNGYVRNPFIIKSAKHLKYFADFANGSSAVTSKCHPKACAKIANDVEEIDMSSICHPAGGDYDSEVSWIPITASNYWDGSFDGNGKTISNLYINANTSNVGMFGYAYEGSIIKNLTLKKAIVKNAESQNCSGILVGKTDDATIQNIVIDAESSISAGSNTGGIVGFTDYYTKISNCINYADVKGTSSVGGIAGNFTSTTLKNVFSNSNVTATESGGLIAGYIKSSHVSGVVAYNKDATLTINGTQVEAKATGSGSLSSTAYTKDEVQSGKLTYALNNGVTDGSQIWYQKLGEDGDEYPMMKSTGENTVYGAYHHGDKDRFFSNTVITNQHSVAYNAEAENEENGNHDVSYEAGEYTWTDAEDKTQDPTVAVTYTCKVCEKAFTPEQMAVEHDTEHDNVAATCTEDGHNYYKTSYTFNDKAVFSDAYTQTLPALGHNMSDEVTFDGSKSIYQKGCTRNCGYHDYYATSDGGIQAKANDDASAFTVEAFTLDDATVYNSEAKFKVTDLTYNRSFSHNKWLAVYVPFDFNCNQLPDEYEMATINNFHEFEQKDGKYNLVLEVKPVINGATIPALTPCLIRMKQAPETPETKTLHFSEASFAAAADKKIDCASVTRYYLFWGTLNAKNHFDETCDFVINEGELWKAGSDTELYPQRWYLNASDREGSQFAPSTQLSRIAIHVIGGDEATGIDGIYVKTDTEDASSSRQGIYDLQGRKLSEEPASGIYIKDGKKYVK